MHPTAHHLTWFLTLRLLADTGLCKSPIKEAVKDKGRLRG